MELFPSLRDAGASSARAVPSSHLGDPLDDLDFDDLLLEDEEDATRLFYGQGVGQRAASSSSASLTPKIADGQPADAAIPALRGPFFAHSLQPSATASSAQPGSKKRKAAGGSTTSPLIPPHHGGAFAPFEDAPAAAVHAAASSAPDDGEWDDVDDDDDDHDDDVGDDDDHDAVDDGDEGSRMDGADPFRVRADVAATPDDILRALNQSFLVSSESAGKRRLEQRRSARAAVERVPEGKPGAEESVLKRNRQRENHANVERRRRDNINECINEFARLVPDLADNAKANKALILRHAVDYLAECATRSQSVEDTLRDTLERWAQARSRSDAVTSQLSQLNEHIRIMTQIVNEMALQGGGGGGGGPATDGAVQQTSSPQSQHISSPVLSATSRPESLFLNLDGT